MSDINSIISKAEDSIENAAYNLEGEFYSATVNRCYYALYYCLIALLDTKNISANLTREHMLSLMSYSFLQENLQKK